MSLVIWVIKFALYISLKPDIQIFCHQTGDNVYSCRAVVETK